jgi:hypothetical protein
MKIDVFTLFPEWFGWLSEQRHVANVIATGSQIECVDFRQHTPLSAGQVDDTPFGGGAGMVLRVDVIDSALRARYGVDPVELRERRRVVALSPGGRLLDDALVDELAAEPELTLLCGRYEGFDERVLEHFASDVVSIGRYVLSGGELAAMVICDAPPSRATPSTPTTPARPSIGAGMCRRCCCRATTGGSSSGAWSAAANAGSRARGSRAGSEQLLRRPRHAVRYHCSPRAEAGRYPAATSAPS